jgi:UDP-N-acetylglucosamine acyltransferase
VIHETAIVSPEAEIDTGVSIGPYSIVDGPVRIGRGTSIGPHVVLRGPTTIGQDCRIFQFASIGEEPQDKKYAGEVTRLEIGDRNVIREFATFTRGTTQDDGVTRIGSDNWIMAYVHVAHDCRVGDHVILANNVTLAGHVEIGDWAILGGFSGLHQFCRVGEHAFLGMYAALGQDVPAYCMIGGTPAQPKGINSEGLKRRGFSREQIANIRRAYRLVYRSGLKLAEATEQLEELSATQPELLPMLESLKLSQRGIIR